MSSPIWATASRASQIGDRVVVNPGIPHDGRITVIGEHTDGTYCELKSIPAAQLYPLDDALTFEEGAAFPLTFETAYRMLVTKASIREGDWVLIWGIGGGVALAAFEIARAHGARTIVTSSSAEKLEKARALGADLAVDHVEGDVVQAVKEATGGSGADIVVETVGEATWERSLAAAAQDGRIVVCGATSGHSPPARLYRLWWKQLAVYGSTMGMPADFEGAYELIRSGRARIHVDSVFPLAESSERRTSTSSPAPSSARSFSRYRASRYSEAENELRVVRHPVGRPGRVEGQLGLHLAHTRHGACRIDDSLRDHRARGTSHRGEAVENLHLRRVDLDVVHQPELHDVHPELGILDAVQCLDHVLPGDHAASVEAWPQAAPTS